MAQDWDSIASSFEALQMWALKSLQQQDQWKDNPEKMPFFVSHAPFLKANAEGMLEILPLLQDNPLFGDLEIGVENFIFYVRLPEKPDLVVQLWSEEADKYTFCIHNTLDSTSAHLDVVDYNDVIDTLVDYLAF